MVAMEIDISFLLSIGSIIIAGLGFIYLRFKETAELHERLAKLETSQANVAEACKGISNLATKTEVNTVQITRLETKIELFWNAMTDNAISALHHPSETELDCLLDKMKQKSITLAEMEQLQLLLQRKLQRKNAGESFWATFMIARIDVLLHEHGSLREVNR